MTLELLSWICALGCALAAGAATAFLLSALADSIERVIYLRAPFRELARRVLVAPAERVQRRFRRRFSWKLLLPAVIGLLVGLKVRHASLMAVYFLASGIVLSLYGIFARRVSHPEQVEELVEKLSSIWAIRPQPFAALAEAIVGIPDPLHSLIMRAVNGYRIGRPPQRIWAELRELAEDPYLRQLVDIVAWAEQAGMEQAVEALEGLHKRLAARRDLRRRSKVALALTSGTARFFQAANAAAVLSVAFVPFIQRFYTQSAARQLLFVVIATWPLLGALYMESEMGRLKEQVV